MSTALRVPQGLTQREERTRERMTSVQAAFSSFELHDDRHPDLTIYATGSLGRAEIGSHSDLDVFIVDTAAAPTGMLGNLDRIKLLRDVILAAESAGFQKFSRDGEYLVVHPLQELVEALGTRRDDYSNVFTARMLLLLESQPLLGDAAYASAVRQVLDLYWRDCDDPARFLPTFLINDVVRYWKTLCLAYEGQRHKAAHDVQDPEQRLKLLKLKFNRVWMCFNGLAYVLHAFADGTLLRADAESLVALTPLQRMTAIAAARPETAPTIQTLLDHYSWFLEATDTPTKQAAVAYFAEQANYEEGRDRGTDFGDAMGTLVNDVSANTDLQRYLLI